MKIGPFIYKTLHGPDARGDWTPYMTRIGIGRLRLHIFHRGDADQDCHDHPWQFWTFPLHPYIEEVLIQDADPSRYFTQLRVVEPFRWHHRPADYRHRVIGRWSGWWKRGRLEFPDGAFMAPMPGVEPLERPGPSKVVTLVWIGRIEREWGFSKLRNGRYCWVPWREYIYGGGRDSDC